MHFSMVVQANALEIWGNARCGEENYSWSTPPTPPALPTTPSPLRNPPSGSNPATQFTTSYQPINLSNHPWYAAV